ncbi:MAG: hypothetical protein R2854_05025 [Caldilineaceae bacterium]
MAVASAPTADSFSGDSTFYIGRSNLADSQVLNFNGEMENFLVVDRAMTARMADVARADAVAVYDLDEPPNAARFVNAVPTGLSGACSGTSCPEMGVEGVAFTAAKFDGNDDLIEIVGSEADAITTYAWNFEDGKTTDWSFSGRRRVDRAHGGTQRRAHHVHRLRRQQRGEQEVAALAGRSAGPRHRHHRLRSLRARPGLGAAAARTSTGSRRPTASPSTAISCWTRTSPTTRRARSANISAFPRTESYANRGIGYFLDGTDRYSGCSGDNFSTSIDRLAQHR